METCVGISDSSVCKFNMAIRALALASEVFLWLLHLKCVPGHLGMDSARCKLVQNLQKRLTGITTTMYARIIRLNPKMKDYFRLANNNRLVRSKTCPHKVFTCVLVALEPPHRSCLVRSTINQVILLEF